MATLVRLTLAALLIPSVTLAQPDRATATEILIAALRVVNTDSLCRSHGDRCGTIVVDTAIRGARNSGGLAPAGLPVIDWAYSRALLSLDVPGQHYVPGEYDVRPDIGSARIAVEFVPPALTMLNNGEVYFEIDTPGSYGFDAVVRVERRDGKWRAIGTVIYHEG